MLYKKNIIFNQQIKETYTHLKELELNTICVEGNCPNIGECFSKGKMTFLILGDTCTRNCLYCNVNKSKRGKELNFGEIENIKKIISLHRLNSVVITSVTRDDLIDGGSHYYALLCKELKEFNNKVSIEILTPDFGYDEKSINTIITSHADILSHNIELTQSLYKKYRPVGNYTKSLDILKQYAQSGKKSKSAFIIGFGETDDDIKQTIYDIASTNIHYLSIGQYLAPSKNHLKPLKYYSHEYFQTLSEWVKENFNFEKIDVSFYSRSSYLDA
ncbi:lipoyl synthase [Sulfuricurvum sp.]|uniref:lipoyl synthase n=1 Tax=Sulfuricurvum sp. TaxID=2025608 RepID=UPI003BB68B56